jgi:hypothetical protein
MSQEISYSTMMTQNMDNATGTNHESILTETTFFEVDRNDDDTIERSTVFNNDGNHHHHHPKTVTTTPHQSYTSVLQGLTLNMDEPWERSLSRLLEDAVITTPTNTTENHTSVSTITTSADMSQLVSPTTTTTALHPYEYNNSSNTTIDQRIPELMLLGRTESRDYALEIEGTTKTMMMMDDVLSRNSSPIRRRSIYRTHSKQSMYSKNSNISTSGRHLNTISKNHSTNNNSNNKIHYNHHKSLFDSDHESDGDDTTTTEDQCRLIHKFSNESLYIFYDHNQHDHHFNHSSNTNCMNNHQQNVEDRCEQEDDSERKDNDTSVADIKQHEQRTDSSSNHNNKYSIHKASAICDDTDTTENNTDNFDYHHHHQYNESWPVQQQQQQHLPDLYLPMF